MPEAPVTATAAEAIRAKAARLLAAATGKPDEGEKRRHAEAMQRIAGWVEAGGAEGVRAALASATDVTELDRQRAGEEVYSLALRRQEQGQQRRLDAPSPAGWETGGHDQPIHVATLRESAALFELSLAIEYESFREYSYGFVLESLGEFDAAARVFDGVTGSHAQYGPEQAERCRQKAAGTYDADAAHAALMAKLPRARSGGFGARVKLGVLRALLWVLNCVASLAARFGGRADDEDDDDAPERPARVVDSATLDRASAVAQVFAEHLAAGDFAAAQELLATPLRHLTAADLRREYTAMTVYAGDEEEEGDGRDEAAIVEEPTVLVMTSDGSMPGLEADDLAWVYVAISGGEFNEAITVVVTDEQGEGRIRELEWGRP